MRYQGQSYEIETELRTEWLVAGDADAIVAAFHQEHRRLFGHADASAAVQMINLRLVISGATPKPQLRQLERAVGPAIPRMTVEAWLDGLKWPVDVYHRADLLADHRFTGPAIIAQDDTTTVVPPGFVVFVDGFGNLVITAKEA
jgi:N-methylhydantoinase A